MNYSKNEMRRHDVEGNEEKWESMKFLQMSSCGFRPRSRYSVWTCVCSGITAMDSVLPTRNGKNPCSICFLEGHENNFLSYLRQRCWPLLLFCCVSACRQRQLWLATSKRYLRIWNDTRLACSWMILWIRGLTRTVILQCRCSDACHSLQSPLLSSGLFF